jgi:hypothetical protein
MKDERITIFHGRVSIADHDIDEVNRLSGEIVTSVSMVLKNG